MSRQNPCKYYPKCIIRELNNIRKTADASESHLVHVCVYVSTPVSLRALLFFTQVKRRSVGGKRASDEEQNHLPLFSSVQCKGLCHFAAIAVTKLDSVAHKILTQCSYFV